MAGNLPLEHIVAPSSGPHYSGATQINSDQPHAGILARTKPTLLRGGYNATHYIIRPGPESMSPESTDLESQSINDQQAVNSGQQLETTSGPLPQSHDPSSAAEIIYEDLDAGDAAAATEERSEEVSLDRPQRSWIWVAALILVVLSLIILPGLIVGLVTYQVAWGITTSGACAPAVVFFGGLFYHHNK